MLGALHATASLECRVPQNATESDTERQETANGLFQPCFDREPNRIGENRCLKKSILIAAASSVQRL
jgi:hypothetical protein